MRTAAEAAERSPAPRRRRLAAVAALAMAVPSLGVASEARSACPRAAGMDAAAARRMATRDLVALLSDRCIGELSEAGAAGALPVVEGELAARSDGRQLAAAFRAATTDQSLFVLFGLLRDRDDPEVQRQLTLVAGTNTDLRSYLALRYFAERGAAWALSVLNDHYFAYPVSSAEWATVAALFGRYRFRPAAEHLAHSVGAASLNLGGAANASLCELFPEAAPEAKAQASPEAAQAYWIAYLQRQHRRPTP